MLRRGVLAVYMMGWSGIFWGVENLHKIYVFFARVEIQHTFLVVYMSPTEIFVTMKETLTGIPISLAYHFDAKSCIRNGFD